MAKEINEQLISIQNYKERYLSMTLDLNEATKRNIILDRKLEKYRDKIETIENENEAILDELNTKDDEILRLEEIIKKIKVANTKLRKDIKTLKAEKNQIEANPLWENLVRELTNLLQLNLKNQEEREYLLDIIKGAEKENRELKLKHKNEINNLKNKLNEEIKELTNLNIEKDIKIRGLLIKIKELKADIAEKLAINAQRLHYLYEKKRILKQKRKNREQTNEQFSETETDNELKSSSEVHIEMDDDTNPILDK